MYMTTMPLAEVRAQLSRVVDEAIRTHERVEITRNGDRAAVILSADDFDVLQETLDVLSDADAVRDIRVALDEYERGETFTTDEVLQDLRAAGRRTS
ncbi:prevent-host-death protein [Luteipulveratus halotolerans]|uniref:Antitoxin n=2 Tax=Luteipulveratus halotolerans TaxID=1631356 RepID=A0A0L6CPU1_9MICO|nr:prevent-host-death protein [Luteipulveratus halotolerans]